MGRHAKATYAIDILNWIGKWQAPSGREYNASGLYYFMAFRIKLEIQQLQSAFSQSDFFNTEIGSSAFTPEILRREEATVDTGAWVNF